MIFYLKDIYVLLFATYSVALATLNVLASTSPIYGYVAILLFHLVAAITFIHRKKLSLLILLLFVTLGTDIGGAVTSDFDSDFVMINMSSVRVPVLNTSFGIFYALLLTIWAATVRRINPKSLVLALFTILFVIAIGLFNPLGQLLHSIQIIMMLIIGYLIGPYLANPQAVRTMLSCAWLSFMCYGIASILGYQRPYSVEYFAFTGGFHNYIFLLPFLTFQLYRTQSLAFVGVVLAYFSAGFLVSGKTIVTFLISLIALLGYRFGAILMACVCFFLAAGQYVQDIAEFLVSNGSIIAGEKLRQLDLMTNLSEIPDHVFYNSSAGNIVAEILTLGRHFLIEGYVLGGGLGASLPDYYGYLSLANDGAYSEQEFSARAVSRLHIALFNFVLWFGLVAVIIAVYLVRKAASFGLLGVICLVLSMIYATTKFDLVVLGALISFLLSAKRGSVVPQRHRLINGAPGYK